MAETSFVDQARARVRSCQTDLSLNLFNDTLFVKISNEDLSSLGGLICSRLSFLHNRIWSKVLLFLHNRKVQPGGSNSKFQCESLTLMLL